METISILIAPDKFKGTLTASEVAEYIRGGLEEAAGSGIRCVVLPLADGGDGTVAASCAAGYKPYPLVVTGSEGTQRSTALAFDGHTAVIEVASICGLASVPSGERDPLGATTEGVGEAIRYAVETLGAQRLVVGLGGSATTDGGAGLLHALGARFFDRKGGKVSPRAGHLHALTHVDLSEMLPLNGTKIIGASDVDNILLGPKGAATMFAPQKGATPGHVVLLEQGLKRLCSLADSRQLAECPGAGSAGGLGYGICLLGGTLVSGAEFVFDLLNFSHYAATADVIITGEGRLDAQSRQGKLVSAVTQIAPGTRVLAVVGCNDLSPDEYAAMGLSGVYSIADRTIADTSQDPAASARILHRIGSEIAARLLRPA